MKNRSAKEKLKVVRAMTLEVSQTLWQAIHYMYYLHLFSVFYSRNNHELVLKQTN